MNNAVFKQSGKFAAFFLFLAIAAVLTACGTPKAEPLDTQLGIDGYVYMPEQLTGSGGSNFFLSGDYIYFNYDSNIYRADLAEDENEEKVPDFSTKVKLVGVGSSVPKKTELYPQESEIPFVNDMREHILSSGASRYSFSLAGCFAADVQQNIYYYIQANVGESIVNELGITTMDMEPIGGMLYRQTPDGQTAYSLFLPSVNGLAADGEGRLYVLTDEDIRILDSSGSPLGTINIDGYIQDDGMYSNGNLFADPLGHVYYAPKNNLLSTIVLELGTSTPTQMKEITKLNFASFISASADGKLIFSDSKSGMVYEYDRKSSETKPILRWEDIDHYESSFRNVIRLSPDKLLAEYWDYNTQTLLLLSKTSVDQLPKKEIVVLASLLPSSELKESVIGFNRQSSQYHVIIETYGAKLYESEGEPRLDATLVSSTPPDLLDMHDVHKYADRDALEDLTPYLEGSTLVPLDDYLETVVDGYTINGKLVCVPTQFVLSMVIGRASQLDALGPEGGWTMEDVYALTEKYPGCIALHTLTDSGPEKKSFILERFCSTYFLEKYVDPESGTCNFDSDGFRQMLTWVDDYSGEPVEIPVDPTLNAVILKGVFMPENALLSMRNYYNFGVSSLADEYRFKEEIRLLGMPTADGGNQGFVLVRDSLGITSNARNKEGAWAFLEYFLSKNKIQEIGGGFPTRKSQLDKMYSTAITPPPIDENTGEYKTMPSAYYGMGEYLPYYFTPQRLAEQLKTAIENSDFSPRSAQENRIVEIVLEEIESYYSGDKTMDEVTKIIQNRCQLILDEFSSNDP